MKTKFLIKTYSGLDYLKDFLTLGPSNVQECIGLFIKGFKT
jgi:hypothetical protein